MHGCEIHRLNEPLEGWVEIVRIIGLRAAALLRHRNATNPKTKLREKKQVHYYSDEYSHVAHGRGPPPERPLRFELGHAAPPGAGSAHPPA